MPSIDKATLEHLAELARLELDAGEEEKLLRDLEKILSYFEELKSLDASDIEPPVVSRVEPMSGGTNLKNIFREDDERENTDKGEGVDAFPETEEGFLRVPPVFEQGSSVPEASRQVGNYGAGKGQGS